LAAVVSETFAEKGEGTESVDPAWLKSSSEPTNASTEMAAIAQLDALIENRSRRSY
jgi:hypothetical protein